MSQRRYLAFALLILAFGGALRKLGFARSADDVGRHRLA
jgi:hypothetical protein